MKRLKLIQFLALLLVVAGCAHPQKAVVSDPQSPWRRYDRCASSGQYRFVDGVTLAVLVGGDLKSIDWMVLGNKPVQIDFLDAEPRISVATLPGQQSFRFEPAFQLHQEIVPSDPVHEIPEGMGTDYDHQNAKLYFGKSVQPLIGPGRFERKGEVKNPRFLTTAVRGQTLSNSPKQGYLVYKMRNSYPFETHNAETIIVEIPSFKLNGQLVETQRLKFVMGRRSNTSSHDSMHCNGSEPRGWWYHILRLFN